MSNHEEERRTRSGRILGTGEAPHSPSSRPDTAERYRQERSTTLECLQREEADLNEQLEIQARQARIDIARQRLQIGASVILTSVDQSEGDSLSSAVRLAIPDLYHGKTLEEHANFMWLCDVNFRRDPRQFHDDVSKVLYAMQYLRGEPRDQWRARETDQGQDQASWIEFSGFLLDLVQNPVNRQLSTTKDFSINAKLCKICRKIDFHGPFFRSTQRAQMPLTHGVLDDLRPWKCGFCRLLHHLVHQTSENRRILDSPFNDQNLRIWFRREGRIQVIGHNHGYGEILLMHEDASILNSAPLSRVIAKGEANIPLLCSWIKDCEDVHCLTSPCHGWSTQREIAYPDNLTLIDVHEKRLVKAQHGSRYAALSYVWGSVSQLETDGDLSLQSGQLPLVVRDAIELVAKLGERYLWVDFFCIDSESRHKQIMQMAAIYSAAHVTVVAVAGKDANAGLPGVRCGSRRSKQVAAKLKGLRFTVKMPKLSDILNESYYNTRAWTFQERILSRRCLYFAQDQVYFQCKTATYTEDILDQSQPENSPIRYLSTKDNSFSHLRYPINPLLTVPEVVQQRVKDDTEWHFGFELYSNLVSQYTEKKLSYDSDIINAFSGILEVLKACCDWSFTSGLPENILDFGLLWIPMKNVVRRGPNLAAASADRQYPSWSWIGWRGRVCYNPHLFCNVYGESHVMSSIDGFWLHDAGRIRQVERETQGPDSKLGSVTFSSSDSSSLILDVESSLLEEHTLEPCSVDLLCFRSSSVSAKAFTIPLVTKLAFRMVDEDNKMDHHDVTPFYDLNGNQCGALYGDIKATWTGQSPDTCAFVLLSKSHVSDWEGSDPEWFAAFDKNRYECTEWCTLNVMFVKVKGDFTERLAIGQMHIDAWNGAMPRDSLIRLA